MGKKVPLREKLHALQLITDVEASAEYAGNGPKGEIESIFRGGGVMGMGSRIFKGVERGGAKREVALKQLYLSGADVDESQCTADNNAVVAELTFLKEMRHRNIVDFHRAFMQPSCNDEIWMVLEYCHGGSIAESMRIREGPLSESEIRAVLFGLLPGLHHLHSHGIVHRDVKCENILIRADHSIVLADLGSASYVRCATGITGTSHWMAPEMASGKVYSEKVDIWSTGITIIEMAEVDTPAMREGGNDSVTSMASPKLIEPAQWSDELIALVDVCVRMSPKERYDASSLLDLQFFKVDHPPNALGKLLAAVEEHHAQEERRREERALRRPSPESDFDEDDDLGSSYFGNSSNDLVALHAVDSLASLKDTIGPVVAAAGELITPLHSCSSPSRASAYSIHFDPVKSPPEAIPETCMNLPPSYLPLSPQSSQGPGLGGRVASSVRRLRSRTLPSSETPTTEVEIELDRENAQLRENLAQLRKAVPYEAALQREKDGYAQGDCEFTLALPTAELEQLHLRAESKKRDLERIKESISSLSVAMQSVKKVLGVLEAPAQSAPTPVRGVPSKPPPRSKVRSTSPGSSPVTPVLSRSPTEMPMRSKMSLSHNQPRSFFSQKTEAKNAAKRSNTYTPKDSAKRDASCSPLPRVPAVLHTPAASALSGGDREMGQSDWQRSRSRSKTAATHAVSKSPPPPQRNGYTRSTMGYVPGTLRRNAMLQRMKTGTKKAVKV